MNDNLWHLLLKYFHLIVYKMTKLTLLILKFVIYIKLVSYGGMKERERTRDKKEPVVSGLIYFYFKRVFVVLPPIFTKIT